jgi:hypothetical protein
MSSAELAKLKSKGVKIDKKKKPPAELSGMAELIAEVQRIAGSQKLKGEEKREELRDVLERMVAVLEKPQVDMKPVISLLSSIAINTTQQHHDERCAYRHEIQRNSKGDMVAIESTPDPKSIN